MSPTASSRPFRLWFVAATLLLATLAPAGPPIGEREIVSVGVEPIDVTVIDPSGGLGELRLAPDRDGALRGVLAWPGDADRSGLTITASAGPRRGDARRVALTATLELPDGHRIRTQRAVSVDGERTLLLEVHRAGGRVLTLAVRLGLELEAFVDRAPKPGAPVRMLLEIQGVSGGRVTTLETNQLQSFVGRSVGYSFRIGDGEGGTHVGRVRLLPERVDGALATIRVDVDGALPDAQTGPTMIARSESLIISRGATATLAVETGSPPNGYRFLVTAMF